MGSGATWRSQVKKVFDGNQIFYIFYFLLDGLALEVKNSKTFFILRTSLVHPSPEKSLRTTQEQKFFIFFIFSRHSNEFIIFS